MFTKLNQRGVAHHLLLVLVVLGTAIGGTAYLVASKAASANYGCTSNGTYKVGDTGPCVRYIQSVVGAPVGYIFSYYAKEVGGNTWALADSKFTVTNGEFRVNAKKGWTTYAAIKSPTGKVVASKQAKVTRDCIY